MNFYYPILLIFIDYLDQNKPKHMAYTCVLNIFIYKLCLGLKSLHSNGYI